MYATPASNTQSTPIITQPKTHSTHIDNNILIKDIITRLGNYHTTPNNEDGNLSQLFNDTEKELAGQILDKIANAKVDTTQNRYSIDINVPREVSQTTAAEDYTVLFEQHHFTVMNRQNPAQSEQYLNSGVDFTSLQKYLVQQRQSQQSCCINNQSTLPYFLGTASGLAAAGGAGLTVMTYGMPAIMATTLSSTGKIVASTAAMMFASMSAMAGSHYVVKRAVGTIASCCPTYSFAEDLTIPVSNQSQEYASDTPDESTPLLNSTTSERMGGQAERTGSPVYVNERSASFDEEGEHHIYANMHVGAQSYQSTPSATKSYSPEAQSPNGEETYAEVNKPKPPQHKPSANS